MKEIIIDAENAVVGRLATQVAKSALLGKTVSVINCEKAVILGSKRDVIAKYKQRRDRGIPLQGPYFPKVPHMLVKRAIRGMLPYKKDKGRAALHRVRCYISVPEGIDPSKAIRIEDADLANTNMLKMVRVGEVCKQIGWKG